MTRRRTFILLGLVGGLILIGAAFVTRLMTADLRPFAERQTSAALDRNVTIAGLTVVWGSPLRIELQDLRIANAGWGSEPDMIRIAGLSAALDVWSLLRGVMRFETLKLDAPVVLLERNDAGEPNWRFKGAGGPTPQGGLAIVPKNRTQFPTLIDFGVNTGAVIYRVPQHDDIRIDFHRAAVRASDDNAPARLDVDGGYNGAPVKLVADTESAARMRDASVPFDARFSLTTAPGRIDFGGTLMEPLDFDGVSGTLVIDTRSLAELLAIFDLDIPADAPFAINSGFDKQGDTWRVSDGRGRIGGNEFDGSITLAEAARGEPDHLTLALSFARLDVNRLLGQKTGATKSNPSLRIDPKPGTIIDARIAAQQFVYDTTRLSSFGFHGRLGAGDASIEKLSFAFAGGTAGLTARADTVPGGTRIMADGAIVAAHADKLVAMMGGDPGAIVGTIDGRATLWATGRTADEALKRSDGTAIVAMQGGSIARHLIEKVSLDLRSLFRRNEHAAEIVCLLGVATIKDGLAAIAPLRLETPGMALVGGGYIDLPSRMLDLTLKAEEGTSPEAAPALKLPIRIRGRFDAIDTGLGSNGRLPAAADGAAALRQLLPDTRQQAAFARCLN